MTGSHTLLRLLFSLLCLTLAGCADAGADQPVRLAKVFDADTILVVLPDGTQEKIRLLGVDAPEVEGYRDAEPGGEEAKARAQALLGGGALQLESDVTADDRDRYGRMLRYVRLDDGRDLGRTLIEDGYARAYRRFTYRRKKEYLEQESQAHQAGRGLWAEGSQGP
jgi:micrococcal nuclease